MLKNELNPGEGEALRAELIASNKERVQAMKNSNLSEAQMAAAVDQANMVAMDSPVLADEVHLTSSEQSATVAKESVKWLDKILRNSTYKSKLLKVINKLAAQPASKVPPAASAAADPQPKAPADAVVAPQAGDLQPLTLQPAAVEQGTPAQPAASQPTTPVVPVTVSTDIPTEATEASDLSPVVVTEPAPQPEELPVVQTELKPVAGEEDKSAAVSSQPATEPQTVPAAEVVQPVETAPVVLDETVAATAPSAPVPPANSGSETAAQPEAAAEPAVPVAEAKPLPSKPAGLHTGCVIEQAVCKKSPKRIGVFKDGDKLAQTDVNRCMKRALDYHLSCGNEFKDVTVARYYLDDKLIASKDTATGCVIDQNVCLKYPANVGNFMDNSGSASSNPARCVLRAMEFYNWCGNRPEHLTVATFHEDGKPTVSRSTASGCLIEQAACRRDSRKAGTFFDNYQNASFDQARCEKRAMEYHNWCLNPFDVPTVARFYVDGKLLAEKDSLSGCNIELKACHNNPARARSFLDNHQSADTDQQRCLRRALEHHMACGNSFNESVTAEFYKNGQKLAAQNTLDGCVIEQGSCIKHPQKVGNFMDNSKNASYDKEVCLKRAREYHSWCGNAYENVVTAIFYQRGEVVAKKDTSTGCVISQAQCRNRPSYAGTFMDYKNGADQLAGACAVRAVQFHKWCGNPFGSFTKATYYENRVVKAEADSSTGCYIDLPVCQRYPAKARADAFIDDGNNATTVSANCLMRADYYHKLCQNTNSDVVTATYYENGIKKVSKSVPLDTKDRPMAMKTRAMVGITATRIKNSLLSS
jgi:hypothetical protein